VGSRPIVLCLSVLLPNLIVDRHGRAVGYRDETGAVQVILITSDGGPPEPPVHW